MAESKANITLREQRLLHTKSGNRCAMCKAVLVDAKTESTACIGENAHIYGEKLGSARFDDSLDKKFVNSEENLIFLCSNCHSKIDKEPDRYSVKYLQTLKKEHENWVIEKLQASSANYGIPELEVLANYIVRNKPVNNLDPSTYLIKLGDKILKNELRSREYYINMALCNINTIEDYLNRSIDQTLGTVLTGAVKSKYLELKHRGISSDEIFEEMWNFTSGERIDFDYKAAGLGILVYFFEKCEVFEK